MTNNLNQPALALAQCKCCDAAVNPNHDVCPVCNFPLKATEQEQNDFIYQRGYKQIELNELKEKSNKASITFFVIGGIIFIWGLIEFSKDGDNITRGAILGVYAFLSLIYIGLGIWSRHKPIPAIITGLVVYGLFTLGDIVADPLSITKGLLFRVLIIVGLVRALNSAREAKKIKEQYKI